MINLTFFFLKPIFCFECCFPPDAHRGMAEASAWHVNRWKQTRAQCVIFYLIEYHGLEWCFNFIHWQDSSPRERRPVTAVFPTRYSQIFHMYSNSQVQQFKDTCCNFKRCLIKPKTDSSSIHLTGFQSPEKKKKKLNQSKFHLFNQT